MEYIYRYRYDKIDIGYPVVYGGLYVDTMVSRAYGEDEATD